MPAKTSIPPTRKAGPKRPASVVQGMTPKQARFVEEYLVDVNATQAAIRAGYSARTAARIAIELLHKTHIAAEIAKRQGERSERVQITSDDILRDLVEVKERCMQRAPVMIREGKDWVQATDEHGRDVWQFDAGGSIKALELLGKHLGMFTGKDAGRDEDRRAALRSALREIEGQI